VTFLIKFLWKINLLIFELIKRIDELMYFKD